MTMKQWSTTPATNASASTGVNWAEGQAPSTVNDSARQLMADVRSWYESAEWIDYGYSITYVSTTVFKFHDANRTALAAVDRRVKAGVGAGTIYGTISDVTFSISDTQVTVTWDSGTLDTSLTSIALGILAPTNRSIWPASTITPGVVQFATQAQVNAATSTSTALNPNHNLITLATEVVSTIGATIDFTGIPAGVRKVTIMLFGVSTNGTSAPLFQIGDSGGIETTGYLGTGSISSGTTTANSNYTAGWGLPTASAANVIHGTLTLCLENSSNHTWIATGMFALSNAATTLYCAGSKQLSPGPLDRVRITTVNGTDTFDAGAINIFYER